MTLSPLSRSRAALMVLFALVAGAAVAENLLAVPKPAPSERRPPSDPITDSEQQLLRSLHRNSVEVFVARPKFGIQRMMITSFQDVITPPAPNAKKDELPREKGKPKEGDSHYSVKETIVAKTRPIAAEGGGIWQLRKLQLVGLVKHPEPVVYDADKVPGMKDIADVPTRPLDDFERAALNELRSGAGMQIERHGDEIRVLGPLYAGKSCTACHEKSGELLGGFTYVLERVTPKGK